MAKKMDRIISLPEKEKERIRLEALNGLSDYSLDKFYERIKKVYERAIQRNW